MMRIFRTPGRVARAAARPDPSGAHARLRSDHGGVARRAPLSRPAQPRRERATLVSIFVNPTQFDDPGDLTRYPRTIERDQATLQAEGADFVLLPRAADLYADGYRYRVTENALSTVLEGAHRPGHFDGVLTVVLKLLHIAAAERAYFGEKDWQQLALVRGMAEAFFIPTAVVACPTIREPDGLAMSSRNRYLPAADRATAARFFHALTRHRALTSRVRTCAPSASTSITSRIMMDDGSERFGFGAVRLIDNVFRGDQG